MNTNIEDKDSKNLEGEEEVIVSEDELDSITDPEELKTLLRKKDETNKQLYARTKKAEGFELVDGKWVKKPEPKIEEKKEDKKPKSDSKTSNDISSTDVFTLIKAGVDEQDIEDVKEIAKLKNVSIAEALQLPLTKQVLADKIEQRKVAEGTNTNGGKRGSSRLSDDALLSNAEKGILPESDEDMNRLAGLQIKKNRN